MKTIKTIVVKVGTSTLTQGTKKLSRRYMLDLVRQLTELHEDGIQTILVSSGAVAAGREHLSHPEEGRLQAAKQMFSAIGQVRVMQLWTELFSLWEVSVGQLLLTREDFSHQHRIENMRNTLASLYQHDVLPIINENDAVATPGVCVGDNDNLAALVAKVISADLLVLLTDQEGLFTADPRVEPNAELISHVSRVDEQVLSLAKGSSTQLGTGGMKTKIEAAASAAKNGIQTIIASASNPRVLQEIVSGKNVGTSFNLIHVGER